MKTTATKTFSQPLYSLNIEGMTEFEAKTLAEVCGLIGGSPDKSGRGVFDEINRALRSQGISRTHEAGKPYLAKGQIDCAPEGFAWSHFDNEELKVVETKLVKETQS